MIVVADAFEREARRGWYPFTTGHGVPEWGCLNSTKNNVADERLMLLARCGVSAVRLEVERDPEIEIPDLEALNVAGT